MIKPCRKCNELLVLQAHEDNVCPMCKIIEDSNMFRNLCQGCQNYFICNHADKEYYCRDCLLDLVDYKRSKEKQQAMNPTAFNKYMENHPNDPTKAPITKAATSEEIMETTNYEAEVRRLLLAISSTKNSINISKYSKQLYALAAHDRNLPWDEYPKAASRFYNWAKRNNLMPNIPESTIIKIKPNEEPTKPSPDPTIDTPKSEVLSPGVDQVPFEGIEAIGAIFAEGEIKYGRGNWKKQPDNDEYNRERCRHAIRHLMLWANGDRSENHIAKVAWFCVTTIWREKNASS